MPHKCYRRKPFFVYYLKLHNLQFYNDQKNQATREASATRLKTATITHNSIFLKLHITGLPGPGETQCEIAHPDLPQAETCR